jgi:8-oxo-dGTP pyrophosphatase MutT (NUDIX family)
MSSPVEVVRAAGGIVVKSEGPGTSRIAVIHRPRYDDWSFPKGKADHGEPDEATALREIREETGLTCEPGEELPTVRYMDALGRSKVVRYWLMTAMSGEFSVTDEVDQIRWLTFAGAEHLLTYEHDRRLVRSAADLLPAGWPAYLVRHAKAGDRQAWTEDDRLRPLTKKGRRQAEGLVVAFRGRQVDEVLTSPYIRCVQSVRPLALDRELSLITDEALSEGAPITDALALLERVAISAAVLCSHGDVIPMLIDQMVSAGADVSDGDWKKGSVWVLERAADGSVVRCSYEAPPPD